MNQSDLLRKNVACLLNIRSSSCGGCKSKSECACGSGGIGGLGPTGGTIGTVLTKKSDADYDTIWSTRSVAAIIDIYDDGTDYKCTHVNSIFTVPAVIGTPTNQTPNSFDIDIRSGIYSITNFPLFLVGCFYLTSAGFWRYTSVRVGNTSGSILSSVDAAVTTISVTGINRANLVSVATSPGMNLKIFITFAN